MEFSSKSILGSVIKFGLESLLSLSSKSGGLGGGLLIGFMYGGVSPSFKSGSYWLADV